MNCRSRICVSWQVSQRAICAAWSTFWRNECQRWETRWEQICSNWETTQTRRCDAWGTEQRKNCSSWGIFSFICLAWVWFTVTVCLLWTWITTTVCRLWTWMSTTLCTLWALVVTVVCTAWVLLTSFVCLLWEFVIDFWCSLLCWIRRLSARNEVSEARSECIYGWTAAYRIIDDGKCNLPLTLRIRLVPDPGVTAAQLQARRAIWEPAIEQMWSGRFPISRQRGDCECRQYQVTLDVQWVATGEHHVVRVRAGAGRADMSNWFITDGGTTAAHECGHMLGNPDEYADVACPNRTVTSDNSIMQTLAGAARERHYTRFATWISNRTCCDYAVE